MAGLSLQVRTNKDRLGDFTLRVERFSFFCQGDLESFTIFSINAKVFTHMYIYIYTYMYIYYIYIYLYIYIYMYMQTYAYIHVFIYTILKLPMLIENM